VAVRWNWGLGVALVYGLFASATVGFAWFAMTERVDLVSDDYYAQSLVHDGRLAAIERVARLGDRFAIDDAIERGRVVVRWPREMAGHARGSIRLYRPADARADRVTAIGPSADGRQRLSLDDLAAGRWIVKVHWTAGGQDFYAERAVEVR
jgi:hypothetical protein